MGDSFQELLADLVRCTGSTIGDANDEHERWPVYLAARERTECLGLLFRAVALEPVPSVALGIVLQVLGRLPESTRPAWIAQLRREDGRDYATRRAKEIAIYQSRAATPLLVDEDVQESWSDWLQLLLAEFSDEPPVLRRLAEKGRTKRIRRFATQRLAVVGADRSKG
jgi:hypothetical protein